MALSITEPYSKLFIAERNSHNLCSIPFTASVMTFTFCNVTAVRYRYFQPRSVQDISITLLGTCSPGLSEAWYTSIWSNPVLISICTASQLNVFANLIPTSPIAYGMTLFHHRNDRHQVVKYSIPTFKT